MDEKLIEGQPEDNTVETVEAEVEVLETGDEGEVDAKAETKPVEDAVDWQAEAQKAKAEAEAAKAEAKRERDKAANLKGKAVHLSKVVKRGLDDGLLSDAELGIDGLDAKEVQVWVEKGVDKDAVDQKLQYFDSQVRGNEAWFEEKYGPVNELIQNYAAILRDDPTERELLDRTPNAVVVDYILRRGKEVADEVADLRTAGSPLALIKQLKAQLAAAQAGEGTSDPIHKAKPVVKAAPSVVVKTVSQGGSFYESL